MTDELGAIVTTLWLVVIGLAWAVGILWRRVDKLEKSEPHA